MQSAQVRLDLLPRTGARATYHSSSLPTQAPHSTVVDAIEIWVLSGGLVPMLHERSLQVARVAVP